MTEVEFINYAKREAAKIEEGPGELRIPEPVGNIIYNKNSDLLFVESAIKAGRVKLPRTAVFRCSYESGGTWKFVRLE